MPEKAVNTDRRGAAPGNRRAWGRSDLGRLYRYFKSNPKNLLVVVALIAVALFAYGYFNTKHQLSELSNPGAASQTQAKKIEARIRNVIELPSNETPLLINVNDANKARGQGSFFAHAKNGDKVLFYQASGRAVLYRPSTGKIIDYSTVNLSQNK